MEYNLNKIGLDKMKLKDIPIKILSKDMLFSRSNVTISEVDLYKRDYQIAGEIVSIGNIVINDSLFMLKLGRKQIGFNAFTNYQIIDFNPAAIIHGSNVKNISCPGDLIRAILIVKKRLEEYGIDADLMKANIDEMEINTNIRLDEEFYRYMNVFELMRRLLPKTYKTSGSFEDKPTEKYTGFKVGNGQITLKFYDKLMEAGFDMDFSLLRVEYRMLKTEKIDSLLGHHSISELIKDFRPVKNAFKHQIEKDIVRRTQDKLNQMTRENVRTLKKVQQDQRYYVTHFLAIMQDDSLFDYDIACIAISKLRISQKSKSDVKGQLRKLLKEREKNGKNLFFNNIDRINEILNKLGFDEVNLR